MGANLFLFLLPLPPLFLLLFFKVIYMLHVGLEITTQLYQLSQPGANLE